MTTESITSSLIAKLKPKDKKYDIRDSRLKGFMVRVQPSGSIYYAVRHKHGGRVSLGDVKLMTPAQAREKAARILADYADGISPKQAEAKQRGVPTLKAFLDNEYAAWLKTHNVSGAEDLRIIERHFSHLFNTPLDQIKAQDIERWRTKKLESKAMQVNTITRVITPLRSTISRAVEWGIIKEHGLKGLKALKYDDTRVRYLSEDERSLLFQTLGVREKRIKAERVSANEWRQARGHKLFPEIAKNEFADHLMPMVVLALNSGARKGELLRLKRSNINLEQCTLFIEKSKNYLARYVPLNKVAQDMLKIWMKQTKKLNSQYLFPSPKDPSKPVSSLKTAWGNLLEEAKIENFRWHDLRHDFASNLVMKNVSLYAVQKLLGHKKIDQTMKYAHLAPDFIAESVGRLDSVVPAQLTEILT